MLEDRFRLAAREGRTLYTAWMTANLPGFIEPIGVAGWDAVLIDQQHGLGGDDVMMDCLVAAMCANLPTLVRITCNNDGLVGRALDAGAQGVVCPMIDSAEEAERFVRAVKYPPLGSRSWGPYRAQINARQEYVPKANGWTIACPQIETRGALDQLDDILGIEGLDMVCLGPNDLSASLTGSFDIHAKEVAEAMNLVLRKCRETSVLSFAFANDIDFAKTLIHAGWNVVAIGTDASWFSAAAADVVNQFNEKG